MRLETRRLPDDARLILSSDPRRMRAGRPAGAPSPMTLLQDILTVLSGSLVGFSLGLIGGGGSVLAVPLLVYVVGVKSPHVAIGTSALAVAANAFVSLIGHWRSGTVKIGCRRPPPTRPSTPTSRNVVRNVQHRRAQVRVVYIMREVVAEFERPVLLFSGGKDSLVLLRLAEKAFRPSPFPFPVMHIDTGHNFPEVLDYRDRRVDELGERLLVASVQESIDRGRVREEPGPDPSRNRLQTVTLLDAIEEHRFDAVFGGARRDEEKARAKERVFSLRDEFGQWEPRRQRPEL